MTEPCFDVAHLGHLERYSDRFDDSLEFLTRVYGLTESAREEDSACVRAFDGYEFHAFKPGMIDIVRTHATPPVGG